MPFLRMTLSADLSDSTRDRLLTGGSTLVAEVLGKPERYVMVTVSQAPLLFGGDNSPAAFVELRSIGGLGPETNQTLSQRLCELIDQSAGIPKERTFLNFVDVPRSHWGHSGATF
jgi:phenylpyruvate tautomerase